MSKSTLASLIGLVALVIGAVFHVEITQDLQLQIVEVIGGLISVVTVLVGIIKKHKDEQNKKDSL